MKEYILLLGSNLGNKIDFLYRVVNLLKEHNCLILKSSSIYRSEPWGFESTDEFNNQAVQIATCRNIFELYRLCMDIEKQLGRVRNPTSNSYEARTIDVDILFAQNKIIRHQHIHIPHLRMHERRFVLMPLDEILPEFIHPVFQLPVHHLFLSCTDKCIVERL